MTGLVTLGETMGLFRPATTGAGELVDDYRLSIGGAESNVAIGVARLGHPATWVGRVGDDPVGRRILRTLRAEGVDTSAHVDAGAPTGLMVKESRLPGHTSVMYARRASAGGRLTRHDTAASLIEGADVLHVTGITPALSDEAADAVHDAVDRAVRAGVPVSFDVNHRASLWRGRDPRPDYRRIAERASIVFAGPEEAGFLVDDDPAALDDLGASVDDTGLTHDRTVAALAGLGPHTVALKLGAAGCVVRHAGGILRRAAHPITVVDTVGAGDAFVAGYLARLLDGASVEDCVETAVATGAFACLGPGDWESFPRLVDLDLLRSDIDPVTR